MRRSRLWVRACQQALIIGGLLARASSSYAQSDREIVFNIDTEPLSTALNQFSEQSDQQILFAPAAVANKQSPPLHGSFTARQGLDTLLKDSGLSYELTGPRTIAIMQGSVPASPPSLPDRQTKGQLASSNDAAIEEIEVTGTSIHGMVDIAPVGSELITVSAVQMQQSGATTLEELFADIPSLSGFGSVGQGQTNSSYYAPTIHQLGASASNSTATAAIVKTIGSNGLTPKRNERSRLEAPAAPSKPMPQPIAASLAPERPAVIV